MSFQKSQEWGEQLSGLRNYIDAVSDTDVSAALGVQQVEETFDKVQGRFQGQFRSLDQDIKFLFSPPEMRRDFTLDTIDCMRRWATDEAPTLTALCAYALKRFNLDMPKTSIHAILMASILGEVHNDLAYHNNMHFRKVLFHLLRLMIAHEEIFEGTARSFDAKQVALMMIAACIHDLGHDGVGNMHDGVFEQGRLEEQSFHMARPYLEAVGFSHVEDLERLKTMILCTEVTPLDSAQSPVNQMKNAYNCHYAVDRDKFLTVSLSMDLTMLQEDGLLCNMALLLHEADIASSAGLSYEVTQYETALLMEEVGATEPRPQHVVSFLDQICQRRFLSDAGQKIYAANMARIFALAEQDAKNGNHAFPPSDEAVFLE